MQCTCAQQHFALRLQLMQCPAKAIFHADRTVPFQQNSCRLRAGDYAQIRAREIRREVGLGGAETLTVLVRHLIHPDALLCVAIEIAVDRIPCLPARLNEYRAKAIGAAKVHDIHRPTHAVKLVGSALVVLGTFEIGQYLIVGPTRIAQGRPMIVVLTMTARIDHGIDGAGATQNLAARLVACSSIEAALRHRIKRPVGLPRLRHQREARRAMNQHTRVDRAGFKKRHFYCGVLAQSRSEHAACGAAANNDVISHAEIVRYVCVTYLCGCGTGNPPRLNPDRHVSGIDARNHMNPRRRNM